MLIDGQRRRRQQWRRVRAPQPAGRQRRHPRAGRHAGRRRAPPSKPRPRAFPAWSATRPGRAPRAAAEGRARARSQGRGLRRRPWRARPAPRRLWAGFNVHLAAGMLQRGRLAHHADRRRGDSLRRARQPGDGAAPAGRRGAGHRAVERAGDPGRARDRDAAGLRQHGGAQGLGDLPGHPRPDHRGAAGSRPAARRRQLRDQRAGRRRRGGRGDGRAPGGAARQLHRLHPRRQADRPDLRRRT